MAASPGYSYRAARTDGVIEFGVVEAATREAAVASLADRRLFPLEIRDLQRAQARRRIPVPELALGLRLLGDLLDAGLPMQRALAAFEELAPGAWRMAVPGIREAVRSGRGLAGALSDAPIAVPGLVIGIIAAAEAGAGLAASVRRAATMCEATAATRAAIHGALAYPIVLAVAGTGSLILMVGVVLPRFATILTDLGQSVPPSTRFVLAAASAGRIAFLPLVVVVIAGILLWRAWTASDDGRARWHALLLRVPVLGGVRLSAAIAHVAGALTALLESGVPLAAALGHASRATADRAIASRLALARVAIVSGARPSRAFEEADALTPTAVRLVRAGEQTGRLAEMLDHAARLEAGNAERATKAAVRLIEPGLILVFGGLVALVAAALLQAVYGVRPS